jgi:hypothetical protein
MQFRPLNQHLGGHQFHNSDDVEMAVCEWLQMQDPDFCHDGSFKPMPRLDNCINVLMAYNEK